MLITDQILRAVMDDRERKVQERLRVRRLIGPRQPTIRWRSGSRQLSRPSDKGRDL